MDELRQRLKAEALRLGFDAIGITAVQPSDHAAFYRAWLEAGRHGEMAYLGREDSVERRLHPERAWPGLRSAIVVASDYWSGEKAAEDVSDVSCGVIARYARGRDYHRVIKAKLLQLLRWLEAEVGRELPAARAYVDTGPVLERELARRAGVGWFGRNTMLLHPRRGSYFFLGSLLTEVELSEDTPFEADHCGRCNACVEACPTGALLGRDANGAPVMDATHCISYLTIEHRGPIPAELRPAIGNRVFGCDICQEVCPWNSAKFVRIDGGEGERERVRKREREQRELPAVVSPSLISLMSMTYDEWDEWTRGTAMRRAGYAAFRRNVAVALGNWGSPQAVPVLVQGLLDSDPLVRGHAAWALGRIGSCAALDALRARRSSETEPTVLAEISLAMDTGAG